MIRQGYDDVRGVVVGSAGVAWAVVYDGRPQSGKRYAETEDEARNAAQAEIARLCAEFAGICYGDAGRWEVRLWEG